MSTLRTAPQGTRKLIYSKGKGRKKRLGRLEREKVSVEEKERLILELKGTETKLKKAVIKIVAQNKSLKK